MKIGDRTSWESINRNYSGIVIGFYRAYAVVQIDGSEKCVLISLKYDTLKK